MSKSWPYWFYEGQLELMTLQDLSFEQKSGKTNFLRISGLLLLAVNWVMTFTICPLYYGVFLVIPFTNQTLIFTTISLLYSEWAVRNPELFGVQAFRNNADQYLRRQAWHHIWY